VVETVLRNKSDGEEVAKCFITWTISVKESKKAK
jgi:hypothetical protein